MKRAMRWGLNIGIPLTLGIMATAAAVDYANKCRGYTAYGSEWLIFPVVFFACRKAILLFDQIRKGKKKRVCRM